MAGGCVLLLVSMVRIRVISRLLIRSLFFYLICISVPISIYGAAAGRVSFLIIGIWVGLFVVQAGCLYLATFRNYRTQIADILWERDMTLHPIAKDLNRFSLAQLDEIEGILDLCGLARSGKQILERAGEEDRARCQELLDDMCRTHLLARHRVGDHYARTHGSRTLLQVERERRLGALSGEMGIRNRKSLLAS